MLGANTYETFYYIVQSLLEFSRRQLKHIEEKILSIEEKVFQNKNSKGNKGLIYETLAAKRDILAFRRIFLTLQNSLVGIDYKGEKF
jgi:hypothetical protein